MGRHAARSAAGQSPQLAPQVLIAIAVAKASRKSASARGPSSSGPGSMSSRTTMRPRFSGGMPTPVSSTAIRNRPSIRLASR